MTIEEVQRAIDLELSIMPPLVKRPVMTTKPIFIPQLTHYRYPVKDVEGMCREAIQRNAPAIKKANVKVTKEQKRTIIAQKIFDQQQAIMAMRRKKADEIEREIWLKKIGIEKTALEKIRLGNEQLEKTRIKPLPFDESDGYYEHPQPKHNWKMPDTIIFEKDDDVPLVRVNPFFTKIDNILISDVQSVVQIAKNYFGSATLTDPAIYYNQKRGY